MKDKDYLLLIKNTISKHIDLDQYKIFLFGSRASGHATSKSDFDIGIMGKQKIPAKTFIQIKEELENLPIFQEIDLIDFSEVSEKFKKVAFKNIKFL